MAMSDIKQETRNYIVENFLFGQDEGLRDGTSFLEQGFMDSTGVLELVAHLESTYGIKVEDDELTPENLDSIELIAAYVQRKKAASEP